MRLPALLLLLSASLPAADPVFPYGAVYFRKSNPPAADWARDHATAAATGMNTFRHWFMWSAIEAAPGKLDWRDYDTQMDLAARNHIQVVLAELDNSAPEWAFTGYAHARYLGADGRPVDSGISGSSATGGFPGLCLDNEDVRALAEKWLVALVERYKGHPATLGYDLWNEYHAQGGSAANMYCYCPATQRKFRAWLQAKYGTLEALGQAWHRYSYARWDDVHPPKNLTGYPESLDWLQFRIDNAHRLAKWRVDLVRRHDPRHKVIAHGVALSLDSLPSSACDEWRSAKEVDVWGFTWVASRRGSEPWKQFHAVDLVRAGSRGKPFWHAEAQAGPLWMQPQVTGRPREDGRIADEKDVRLWNMISIAGGATGILYPRWRPLLDGPLFGAFGAFGMDGSVTPRAEAAGQVARWANANPELWKSRPVRGEVGIAWVPESQLFNYVQQGSTDHYAQSARGAYRAFFDQNIQADFVHVDNLGEYPLVYLPYPIHLQPDTVRKLAAYVNAGGILVSEGLPAYFGEHGKVGTVQPNLGLDQLFGARESYVEFTPDLLENYSMTVRGRTIPARYFVQEYELAGGRAAGAHANGHTGAVEHTSGKGRTLLIGSFPGAGYFKHPTPEARSFFAGLLEWAGLAHTLTVSDPHVQARLHRGPNGSVLYVINPTRDPRPVTIGLSSPTASAKDVWQNTSVRLDGRRLSLTLTDRNTAVIRLD